MNKQLGWDMRTLIEVLDDGFVVLEVVDERE
jgi:hypothetical protein